MTRALVIMLALVAGWVDAGSFVGLHHIMAAHITGNLVILAADIATGLRETDLLKIIILPIFFVAVMVVTLVHDRYVALYDDPARHIRGMLAIEAVLIAATGVLGLLASLKGWALNFRLALAVATPVTLGMALQNAIHRLYPVVGPATTVMTGNITQFFIDRTRGMIGRTPHSLINDMPKDNSLLPILILAFGLGCVLGAVTTAQTGNGAFLVPAALILVSVPLTWKVDRAV
ncbi:MAG: YoaK family protein [Arenicellales bacterium]